MPTHVLTGDPIENGAVVPDLGDDLGPGQGIEVRVANRMGGHLVSRVQGDNFIGVDMTRLAKAGGIQVESSANPVAV